MDEIVDESKTIALFFEYLAFKKILDCQNLVESKAEPKEVEKGLNAKIADLQKALAEAKKDNKTITDFTEAQLEELKTLRQEIEALKKERDDLIAQTQIEKTGKEKKLDEFVEFSKPEPPEGKTPEIKVVALEIKPMPKETVFLVKNSRADQVRMFLMEKKGRSTKSEICKATGIKPPNLGSVIENLAKLNIIYIEKKKGKRKTEVILKEFDKNSNKNFIATEPEKFQNEGDKNSDKPESFSDPELAEMLSEIKSLPEEDLIKMVEDIVKKNLDKTSEEVKRIIFKAVEGKVNSAWITEKGFKLGDEKIAKIIARLLEIINPKETEVDIEKK